MAVVCRDIIENAVGAVLVDSSSCRSICLEAVATARFEHVTIECPPRAAICRTLLIVRGVLDVKTCFAAGFVPPKSQVVGELAVASLRLFGAHYRQVPYCVRSVFCCGNLRRLSHAHLS